MSTSKNNSKATKKTKPDDDSVFSKNNGKSVRYRLRKQQEFEAKQEVKEYAQFTGKDQRVP